MTRTSLEAMIREKIADNVIDSYQQSVVASCSLSTKLFECSLNI